MASGIRFVTLLEDQGEGKKIKRILRSEIIRLPLHSQFEKQGRNRKGF